MIVHCSIAIRHNLLSRIVTLYLWGLRFKCEWLSFILIMNVKNVGYIKDVTQILNMLRFRVDM
jgi:hypothetical protein